MGKRWGMGQQFVVGFAVVGGLGCLLTAGTIIVRRASLASARAESTAGPPGDDVHAPHGVPMYASPQRRQTAVELAELGISDAPEVFTVVTAADMAREYDANEVAADLRFKAKRVEISGVVDAIRKGPRGRPLIDLANPKNKHRPVEAELLDTESKSAAALQKGARVTMWCDAAGPVAGVPTLKLCAIR